MGTSDDRIAPLIDALLDRSRDHLRAELDALVHAIEEAAAGRRDQASRAARAEAEAAAAAMASAAIAAEREGAERRQAAAIAEAAQIARTGQQDALDALRAELDEARASAVDEVEARAERDLASAVVTWRATERQSEMALATALADGIRSLDQANSLSETLDALVAAASVHASRAALLVLRDNALRGWSWRGFPGDPTEVAIMPDAEHLAAAACRSGVLHAASDLAPGTGVLAPRHAGRAAVAVPLAVAGRPVAVLYCDDDGEEPRMVPSAWPEIVEVLARHASRCLESMTARRLPDLVRASAAERARLQSRQQDDESAQRYARLLVAEIKLYHEAAVDEARREGAILRRLRPQIERAERMYADRVPEPIRVRTQYFEQELVRTLAGGDASLLGQAT